MITADGQIQFMLQPVGTLPAIDVRMRRFGERWIAEAGTGLPNVGMAVTPRAALAAALAPLGTDIVRRLLADLSLLEPSRDIAQLEASPGA